MRDAFLKADPDLQLPFARNDGRAEAELRPLKITPSTFGYAEGSCLVEQGNTRVLVSASIEERVPRWMLGKGRGWVTAEYSMLPRATKERTRREVTEGRQGGRTVEIQRLIGRSLRSVTDLEALGERMVTIDCDVLQADAGTRCASITGGYVALSLACRGLLARRAIKRNPLRAGVAAISVGVVKGRALLDLDYSEDGGADVDFNLVMTDQDEYVEIQGTAEKTPFSPAQLAQLLELAQLGLIDVFAEQRRVLGG
ncbi:MAG TPA: ribonuclease PH [Thermomicrobiales bacterium]|jgi:ribonuclease PH|nr:ribonuclease PH [Thermomicrobiales bacterium]